MRFKGTKNKLLLALLLVSVLAFTQCSNNVVYSETRDLPQDGWHMNRAAEFSPMIDDTTARYDIYFRIAHTDYFGNSNLWLFCKTVAPNGAALIDTISIELANRESKWLGAENDKVFTGLFPYKLAVQFKIPGQYTFLILQGMRDETLSDVQSFGLQIEKIK